LHAKSAGHSADGAFRCGDTDSQRGVGLQSRGRRTATRTLLNGGRSTGETMPRSWSDKRERQYEHIKESYEDRGRSPDKAEELAARTVNKERSEAGETKASKKR
jgi:hypothetical protein